MTIDPLLLQAAWVPALVILYGLLRWRLMVATHDFRTRVGCEADRMADDERLDEWTRATLSSLADRAYGPTAPWLIVLGVVIAAILPRTTDARQLDDEVASLLLKLFVAVLSTSPIAFALASVVFVLCLVLRSVDMLLAAVPAIASRLFVKPAAVPA